VGRVNYSLKDRRVTDSVLGLEYDAGCWIARVVAMRMSTGRSEATTRLGIQLELTGFSKLNVGSNPLKVLKDNIPGYRLLREEPSDRLRRDPSTLNPDRPTESAPMTDFASRRPFAAPRFPRLPAYQAAVLAALLGVALPQGRKAVRATTATTSCRHQPGTGHRRRGGPPHRPGAGAGGAARAGMLPPPSRTAPPGAGRADRRARDHHLARESGMRVDDADLDRAVQSIAQQNQLTLDQCCANG
jgi:hypothetical protein